VRDLKNVGLRIKACRTLTGLNQEEFSTKHSFSLPSVKSWEFGRVVPRMEGLQKLVDALRLDSIYVKINWLLFGEGMGPSFFLDSADTPAIEYAVIGPQFNANFIEGFKLECKKKKQNPIVSTVDDDEMSPFYRKGDVIAGILIDDEELKSNYYDADAHLPMISMLSNGNYGPRWIHVVPDGVYMSSIKFPHIKKIEHASIARICWHLRLGV
jgi:transcriptional regulator with XRE-family HTH domain